MENEITEHTERKEREANSGNTVHDGIKPEPEECSNSRICSNTQGTSPSVLDGEEGGESGRGGDFAIGVGSDGEDLRAEILCRICHLSCSEPSLAGGSELIELGCRCRGELGMSHRYCAETWFNQRGNRACEICGATAKNVKITKKPTRIWIVDFDDMRAIEVNSYASSRRASRVCSGSCCKLLVACVVLCLVIPWFFRIKLF